MRKREAIKERLELNQKYIAVLDEVDHNVPSNPLSSPRRRLDTRGPPARGTRWSSPSGTTKFTKSTRTLPLLSLRSPPK